MSKVFNHAIEKLSRESSYDYDFLVDIYAKCMSDDGDVDWKYFSRVSMERDW